MIQILTGDCMDVLPTLPAQSVQCCVTSPPYWGLRDYGTAEWEGGDAGCEHTTTRRGHGNEKQSTSNGTSRDSLAGLTECRACGARRIDSQLGLESTPEEYLARMVTVFRELWRVLRDDGTLWVNMGDSYAQACGQMRGEHETKEKAIARLSKRGGPRTHHGGWEVTASRSANTAVSGLKPKDLCMMPARLAMALQADGWYLRSDIIWHKPNPMPESVTDRPTKSHEYIFLLAKNGGKPLIWRARDTGEWSYEPDLSEKLLGSKKLLEGGGLSGWDSGPDAHTKLVGRYEYDLDREDAIENDSPRWKGFDYFYDADAIREASSALSNWHESYPVKAARNGQTTNGTGKSTMGNMVEFRNKRTVWTVATQPYSAAHFATFPEDLIKPCIMAGSRVGDTVLDPFGGSGTTGKVAIELGRKAILIELNTAYVELAKKRTDVTPAML